MADGNLINLLKTRRTYRRFKQIPISNEDTDYILQAGRYASCSGNRQPLRYYVIRSEALVAEVFPLTHWALLLPPSLGVPKEGERPVMFLLVAVDTEIAANADTDAGLAISNITLAAWDKGIGSCIIGACEKERLSALLQLPQSLSIHSVVAFGYPSHSSYCTDVADTTKYSIDQEGNYAVPKRRIESTVEYR